MSSTTTSATIDALREMYTNHSIPKSMIPDNGVKFTSTEFRNFLKGNVIRQVLIEVAVSIILLEMSKWDEWFKPLKMP